MGDPAAPITLIARDRSSRSIGMEKANQVLAVPPDEHTSRAIAQLLHEGAMALQEGFSTLKHAPALSDKLAEHARKTERRTEKLYLMPSTTLPL